MQQYKSALPHWLLVSQFWRHPVTTTTKHLFLLIPRPPRLLPRSPVGLHRREKTWPSRWSLKLHSCIEAGIYSDLLEPVPFCLINILNDILPTSIIIMALIVLYCNYSSPSWLPSTIIKHLRTGKQSDSSSSPSALENYIVLIDVW